MVEYPRLKNTRSNEFRYVYANGLAAQVGGNEIILIFGIKEGSSPNEEAIREEVAVAMTPSVAKSLAISLANMIEHIESNAGVNIPVEQEKLDLVAKALKDATVTKPNLNPSPTA